MGILIKNGKIINANGSFVGDVRVEGNKIKEVGEKLDLNGCYEIDASGKWILPGGIDPHVHMHLNTAYGFSSDDFESGSQAAIFGGTTTLIDFVTPERGQNLVEALDQRLNEAQHCLCDYTFHVSPVDLHPGLEDEIKACSKRGIQSFKLYMAYKESIGLDDQALASVMKMIADAGAIAAVHCELGDEIESIRNRFFQEGKRSPHFHPLSRPNYLEAGAVERILHMAKKTNCPLYIVHVSTRESISLIAKAQKKGQKLIAETCPQYLLLDQSVYAQPFERSADHVCSPPYRSAADREQLWKAIKNNNIRTIGTDHCPFFFDQKKQGLLDFRKIPNGIGGVEHRLSLLFHFGVLPNLITPEEWISLVSANPAKIFGFFPHKGSISAGADADIVIWDPELIHTISAQTHHQHCDRNVYDGMKVQGKAILVIKDGKIALQNDQIQNTILPGQFIGRKLVQEW